MEFVNNDNKVGRGILKVEDAVPAAALHDLLAPFKFVFQCAQGTHRMRDIKVAYVAHSMREMLQPLESGAALEIKENKVEPVRRIRTGE